MDRAVSICVPSFRKRKGSILERLNSFSKDREILVFVYESDFSKSGYDKTPLPENAAYVKVPDSFLSIQKMRQFIQDYMGNKTYWMIDDDVKVEEKTLSHVEAIQGYAILGPFFPINNIFPLKLFEIPLHCILIDGKCLRENKVFYTGDPLVHEDIEILLAATQKGLKVGIDGEVTYGFGAFGTTLGSHKELYKNTVLKLGHGSFPTFEITKSGTKSGLYKF